MSNLPQRFEHKDSKGLFSKGDVDGLVEALQHPDVRKSRLLRERVVEELENPADPRAVPALVDVLEGDPDMAARVFAADALGKVDDKRGLPALRKAIGDPEQPVRAWAIRSIGQVADRNSVDALIACLDDGDSWVRESAARALGQIGDHRATMVLAGAVNDPRGLVRKAAVSALVELGDWNAVELLRKAQARAGLLARWPIRRALRELEDRFG